MYAISRVVTTKVTVPKQLKDINNIRRKTKYYDNRQNNRLFLNINQTLLQHYKMQSDQMLSVFFFASAFCLQNCRNSLRNS